MVKIELYGVIGQDVFSSNVKNILDDNPGAEVEVLIDSPGGNLSEGVLIFNLLRSHDGAVKTVNMARAYSIASYIFMAGDKRVMAENALFMMHEARVDVQSATIGAMEQAQSMLSAANRSIRKEYAKAMGMDEGMVQTLWDGGGDVWFTSDECILNGIATETLDVGTVSASFLDEIMAIAPSHIINHFIGDKMQKVSIEQLEALGAPADFILAQLKAEATELDACKAYIEILKAEFPKKDEEEKDKDEAKNEEEKEDEAKAEDYPEKDDDKDEAKAEEKEEDEAEAFEKEEDEAEAKDDEEEAEAKEEDEEEKVEANLSALSGAAPVAVGHERKFARMTATQLWNKAIDDKVQMGMDRVKAVVAVAKENPSLRQEMIDEANN